MWYVDADDANLNRLLVYRNGQRHSSLAQGLVPETTVRDLCARAKQEVHPIMADLAAATPDQFIQTIMDVTIPQTLFGRVMLLGDAAIVMRPHTAAAAAKAAHAQRCWPMRCGAQGTCRCAQRAGDAARTRQGADAIWRSAWPTFGQGDAVRRVG